MLSEINTDRLNVSRIINFVDTDTDTDWKHFPNDLFRSVLYSSACGVLTTTITQIQNLS